MRADEAEIKNQELEAPGTFKHPGGSEVHSIHQTVQNGKNSNYNTPIPKLETELYSKHRKERRSKSFLEIRSGRV
jgi:hypothetical protein